MKTLSECITESMTYEPADIILTSNEVKSFNHQKELEETLLSALKELSVIDSKMDSNNRQLYKAISDRNSTSDSIDWDNAQKTVMIFAKVRDDLDRQLVALNVKYKKLLPKNRTLNSYLFKSFFRNHKF